jgi:type IV secretory pathway TraG/TraD family ATPase VirD4
VNALTVVMLAVLLVAARLSWQRGASALAAGLAVLAVLPALSLWRQLDWPALLAAAAVAGTLAWNRWARSAGLVTRWSARTRRKAGVASTFDVLRRGGGWAMRRRAGTVRPSLAGLSRWRRLALLRTREVAVRLCRAGLVAVWSSIEDVTLVFGGPRTGKTGWLAGRVLDAPGAVLVTSTRTDLHELTAELRGRRGPVFVFNPVGLAGLPSTITFDPLTGCADPVTAAERATDLLAATGRRSAGNGSGDREFWDAQARRVLAALLHAAALGARCMPDVLGWVADPERAARDVPALLRRSGVPAFEQDALQFIGTNERTRTSITSTVMPALGWLTHPAAAVAAASGPGFDVAELLAQRATVFLLGAEETQVAPLVCALTGHIAREARGLAAGEPGGRLDPPLTLALDEAALISPVPLESWTADMGGRGVTILAAFQSRAQLLARWGEHNAATILNNTGALMVFGGTRDRDDLQFWSTLAGERDERITTTDLHGRVASRTLRRVPVLPPAQIANLPTGKVLLIRRGLGPVIGRAQMAWRRRDVRAAAFARNHPVLAAGLRHCATGIQALVAGGYARAAALLGATAAPLHVAYVVAGRAAAQAVQRIGRRLRGRQEEAPPGPAQGQPIADGHEHAAPWSAQAWPPVDANLNSSGAASDLNRLNGAPIDDAWRPR